MWQYAASFVFALGAAAVLFPPSKTPPALVYLDQYGRSITQEQFEALTAFGKEAAAKERERAEARRKQHQQDLEADGAAFTSAHPIPQNGPGAEALLDGRTAPSFPAARPEGKSSGPKPPRYGCAENGSCYGDLSRRTQLPKHHHLKGYRRANGDYVRGHYRSRR